jgi:hypothetical protein
LINKKTVFVLGAGASCPYGYPSADLLRKRVCLSDGFKTDYIQYLSSANIEQNMKSRLHQRIQIFISVFDASHNQSIDLFIARNRDADLASTGKYVIAFEMLKSEQNSCFGEHTEVERESRRTPSPHLTVPANILRGRCFQGGDWYSLLFSRLTAGLTEPDVLPDFSDDKITFITFNYDRSLEQFLYESLSHSFTEVPEPAVGECLKKLKILHVYGQIAPLRWQDPKQGVDYKPHIEESLLERTAANIKTIHEQEESPESNDIQNLIKKAEQIFFLGFGYAPENMEALNLIKTVSPAVQIYGTAFNLEPNEINNIKREIDNSIPATSTGYKHQYNIKVEDMDCLKLLRNYL